MRALLHRSQASSTKLPQFLRFLSARLAAFVDSHPSLAISTSASSSSPASSSSTPPEPPLLDFLAAQLAALEPLLAAPRPRGKSTLFNTNLAGGMAALGGMGAPGGGGRGAGAGEADREFSRIARGTAEGLKTRLKCVSLSRSLFLFGLSLAERRAGERRAADRRMGPCAGLRCGRRPTSSCTSSGSRPTRRP